MKDTESRREFEEWAKDNHAYLDLSFNNDTDAYRLRIPQISWEAWHAARERQNQELSAARKALLEISEMDYDEGDIWEQAEKIQAIAHNTYYHPPTSEKPLTHTREQYEKLKGSGMMWEIFPNFTGNYEEDVLNPPTSEKI